MQRLKQIIQSVGGRVFLSVGFALALLTLIIVLNLINLDRVSTIFNRVENLRFPTARTSSEARVEMLDMLANIRGYLVLGNSQFATDYEAARADFESELERLETLSANWTNPENVTRLATIKEAFESWKELPPQMFELRDSPLENQETVRILEEDVRPQYAAVLEDITELIDIQAGREPSENNTALLLQMANFRGSWGPAFAALADAVGQIDDVQRDEYDRFMERNTEAYIQIGNMRSSLTLEQRRLWDDLDQARQQFLQWPDTIFSWKGPLIS